MSPGAVRRSWALGTRRQNPPEAAAEAGAPEFLAGIPKAALPPHTSPQLRSSGLSISLYFSVSMSPCISASESEIPGRAAVGWLGPGGITPITEHGSGGGMQGCDSVCTKGNSLGFQAGGPWVSPSTRRGHRGPACCVWPCTGLVRSRTPNTSSLQTSAGRGRVSLSCINLSIWSLFIAVQVSKKNI